MRILAATGFLGSGKTTMLLGLARHLAGRGENVGILVNDNGEIAIDGAILGTEQVDVVELFAGCLCLMRDDLFSGLAQLHERGVDRVLVEPSGTANALRLKGLVEQYQRMAPAERDSGVTFISVLDCERHMMLSRSVGHLLRRSIQTADSILLNKADLVPEERVAQIATRVRRVNPRAPITPVSAASGVALEPVVALL